MKKLDYESSGLSKREWNELMNSFDLHEQTFKKLNHSLNAKCVNKDVI